MMIVDLVLAVARGAAELPAFAALLGVRLAHPRAERPGQLGAVRPQVDVIAGVRAELAPRAVVLTHAARLTLHVGHTQTTPIVSAAEQKHADFIRHSVRGPKEGSGRAQKRSRWPNFFYLRKSRFFFFFFTTLNYVK